MPEGSRSVTAFVAVLAALAVAAVAWAARAPLPWVDVLLLCGLAAVADLQISRLGHERISISLVSIVITASLVVVGAAGAAIVAVMSAIAPLTGVPLLKRIYNTAQIVLCALAGGLVYELLGGPVGRLTAADFPSVLVPVLGANIAFCVANALLLSTVLHLSTGVAPWGLFRGVLLPSVPAYLAYGLFGLILAALWTGGVGPVSALLLLLPLLIARWVFAQYAAEKDAYDATVRTLIQAVETKDPYTRGHSERVAHGAVLIGRQRGMPENRVESLRYAGLLHDLGKIGVPTRILQKVGRLDDSELASIRLHPVRGVEMVRDIEFLDGAREGILHHHERVDGLGYPMGLRGDDIPEFARIIAVADAFDAMTTVRSYRGARTIEEARAELERGAGTQFDPAMVRAFFAALDAEGWQVPEAALPPLRRPPVPVAADGPKAALDHDDPAVSLLALRRLAPGDLR